jgi:hypothetical protein
MRQSTWIIIFLIITCSLASAEERPIYVFNAEMDYKLVQLKETSMDIIILECNSDYINFYECAFTRMYAMNHVIRHYQSFGDDMAKKSRPANDISTDFEALNELLIQWKRYTPFGDNGTFNFIAILDDYENLYLPSRY